MKKLIAALIILISALVILPFFIDNKEILTKLNISAQLLYTLVTTILVVLTFLALNLTKEQKHQIVKPYLMISSFDISMVNNNDEVEFFIYNEGLGLAKNISIKVFDKDSNSLLYESSYARLNVESGNIAKELDGIQQSISNIKKERDSIVIPSQVYPNIDIEFTLKSRAPELFSCKIELVYSDMYDKKYKSNFILTYNVREDEITDFNENFKEL